MKQAERCLWCGGELSRGKSFEQLMLKEDSLCGNCRKKMIPYGRTVKIGKLKIYALYVYDEQFMKFLVQYKECMDEALKDIFCLPYLSVLKRKTKGKILVPMPSSKEKREIRGFDTLQQLYGQLERPFADLLEKKENFQQSGNREKRKKNAEAIVLKKGVEIPEKKMILVDDVVTTGSTLEAAVHWLPQVDEALVLAVNHRLIGRSEKTKEGVTG